MEFSCWHDSCFYKSNRKSNMVRHLAGMHTAVVGKVLECCSISFTNKAKLRRHLLKEHKDGYRCKKCHKTFNRRALLERHTSVHDGPKKHKCDQLYCKYVSSHKSNVERHIANVHKRPKVPATDASPHSEPQLHLNSTAATVRHCDKPFKCLTCQSSFDSQQEYTVHLASCPLVHMSAAGILMQFVRSHLQVLTT